MPDDPKGIGDGVASLGAALTSPAKIAFAGYIVVVYKGALGVISWWQFVLVSGMFVLVQAFHDDFVRILLNRWAYGIAKKSGWPEK
jgi:hypothetical protein